MDVKKIQTEAFGTTQLLLTWLYLVMLMSDPGPHLTSFLNLLQLCYHDVWAQALSLAPLPRLLSLPEWDVALVIAEHD